mgnify:CR=1 FL=1|jgi:hypothetical protein
MPRAEELAALIEDEDELRLIEGMKEYGSFRSVLGYELGQLSRGLRRFGNRMTQEACPLGCRQLFGTANSMIELLGALGPLLSVQTLTTLTKNFQSKQGARPISRTFWHLWLDGFVKACRS